MGRGGARGLRRQRQDWGPRMVASMYNRLIKPSSTVNIMSQVSSLLEKEFINTESRG